MSEPEINGPASRQPKPPGPEDKEQSEDITEDPSAAKEADEKDPKDLTPEEQLARYEESLKNDDWGHQPC
ncbi:MAG: hypothetical protein VCA35_05460 [Roseibacillus sp.]